MTSLDLAQLTLRTVTWIWTLFLRDTYSQSIKWVKKDRQNKKKKSRAAQNFHLC